VAFSRSTRHVDRSGRL